MMLPLSCSAPFLPASYRKSAQSGQPFLNKMLNIAVVCEFALQALDFFWK
jgi:hypothetical protein